MRLSDQESTYGFGSVHDDDLALVASKADLPLPPPIDADAEK